MARKWFQLKGEDGSDLTSADAVSVAFEDVVALRDAVFAKVSRALPATVIAADLTVFANQAAYDAKQALPRSSSSVTGLGNDEDDALIVQVPQRAEIASIKKQLRYKGMSTEASCRKFLDALAQKLAILYDFDYNYGIPTIGDVVHAINAKNWGFRKQRGQQLTQIKLPDFYEDKEWKFLEDLNRRTTRRIHDGIVPKTSKGHPYIVLPRDLFGGNQVETLKNIAAKGNVVFVPSEFDVKNEDEFMNL